MSLASKYALQLRWNGFIRYVRTELSIQPKSENGPFAVKDIHDFH